MPAKPFKPFFAAFATAMCLCAVFGAMDKAAAPIVSELVRLKALIEDNYSAFNDALVRANLARTSGDMKEAAMYMEELVSIGAILKSSKDLMMGLNEALEKLGPMPDPAELMAAKRKSLRESRKVLEECFMATDASEGAQAVTGSKKEVPAIISDITTFYQSLVIK